MRRSAPSFLLYALACIILIRIPYKFRMFDVRSNEWHILECFPPRRYLGSKITHGGGLLCFYLKGEGEFSDWEDPLWLDIPTAVKQLPVLVMIPLTNAQERLPMQLHFAEFLRLLELVVDSDSKQYKVIVVGHRRDNRNLAGEIYDSSTGVWSTVDSGQVFGYQYDYKVDYEGRTVGIFDPGRGELSVPDPWPPEVSSTEFQGSHYVLQRDTEEEINRSLRDGVYPEYTISEYRCYACSLMLTRKIKADRLDLDLLPDEYRVTLLACNGWILLIEDNCNMVYQNRHQVMRIYDMSAGKWFRTSEDKCGIVGSTLYEGLMCELQWDAVP